MRVVKFSVGLRWSASEARRGAHQPQPYVARRGGCRGVGDRSGPCGRPSERLSSLLERVMWLTNRK
jgi:hypothetical protein